MTSASNGDNFFWKWPVDPFTRKVKYRVEDLWEIWHYLLSADVLVAHNHTYDCHELDKAFEQCKLPRLEWPWERMEDTMSSAHLLASSTSKNLTDQVIRWVGVDISKYERHIQKVTQDARTLCQRKAFTDENGKWFITRKHAKGMPSAGEEAWKGDMWLPETIVDWVIRGKVDEKWLPESRNWKRDVDPLEDHPWKGPLDDYATTDPMVTLALHGAHSQEIDRRGIRKIYDARRMVLQTSYGLETNGITLDSKRRKKLTSAYVRETHKLSLQGVELAGEPDMTALPKGPSKLLKKVLFQNFKLVAHEPTKSGSPECTNARVVKRWLEELDRDSKAYQFLDILKQFRQRTTALNYMRGYERFWRPTRYGTTYRLHPFLNYFGPRTLRTSSSQPNEQNISKKEGFNLRYAFGPAPGRVWAAIDYANQELRIPAYSSGETALIGLFEDPDAPPYYGSNHLLNFEAVYPDLWEKAWKESGGKDKVAEWIKANWKATWYQNCKNGGFAVQYGSVDNDNPDKLSTADKAFGRKGCHRLLKERFASLEAENQRCIREAAKTGYVCTMKDSEVDPNQGYPLECEADEHGYISPTQPFNTFVQGTACWITYRATVKVNNYLADLNERMGWDNPLEIESPNRGAFVTAQVHDELVLDLPLKRPNGQKTPYRKLLRNVQGIMESLGDAVNVPMKTGCDIHFNNWTD